ncbi:MAG: NADH-quinone oxidoreductase subunit M [Candidatus Margulisiibacteriota bacterium]
MDIFVLTSLVLLFPFLGSVLIFLFGRDRGFFSSGVWACVFAFASMAAALLLLFFPPFDKTVSITGEWIKLVGIKGGFYCDGLSMMAAAVSSVVAFLAVIYSLGYFKNEKDFNSRAFYSLVMLFLAGLTGVFFSSDLILFYLFWEMMLLPTFAFVAYFGADKARSFAIAVKYFIFTHLGAVLLLFAFLMLFSLTGTTDMLSIKYMLPAVALFPLKIASLLLFFGFAVKLAVFPMHSWLPETYVNAPYPATVLMSAVMMNAGIYGLLRFLFGVMPRVSVEPYLLLMMSLAVISQLYGASLAYVEKNIKKLVAYSSISQMGYVLFGAATATALGISGAAFHLVNHSVIKALLFMTAGAVFFSAKNENTEQLGGLARALPFLALLGSVACLAISGVPLFGAFQSEWMIFAGGFMSAYPWLAALSVLGIVLTAAYALRFVAAVFFGEKEPAAGERPGYLVYVPMVLLALATLLIGLFPGYVSSFVRLSIKMLGV